jgi:hypothetical protein
MLSNHLIPPIRLPGTAEIDNTSPVSDGHRLFNSHRFRKFRQAETPRLPLAIPDGMGGNAPIAGQLQHSPTGDAKELRASLSIHEWLNLRHTTLRKLCSHHLRFC